MSPGSDGGYGQGTLRSGGLSETAAETASAQSCVSVWQDKERTVCISHAAGAGGNGDVW